MDNTKKILLLTVVLAATILAATPFLLAEDAEAADGYTEGQRIVLDDREYTVVTHADTKKYTDSTLPSSHIYVASPTIGNGAFEGCTMLYEVLTDDCVKHVGDSAFKGCERLYRFQGYKTETVGDYAFQGCDGASFSFGVGLKSVGKYCFADCARCYEFTDYTPNLTYIPEGAFGNTPLECIDMRGLESYHPKAFGEKKIVCQLLEPWQKCRVDADVTLWVARDGLVLDFDVNGDTIHLSTSTFGDRITVTDSSGNRISSWMVWPFMAAAFTYEAGEEYNIDLERFTISFPTATGLETIHRFYEGKQIDLPRPEIDGLQGWTLDGSTSFWSISTQTLHDVGPKVRLRGIVPGATITYDHSSVAKYADVSALPSSKPFLLGDRFADMGCIAGYRHEGWEVDGEKYKPGDEILQLSSFTAGSLWVPAMVHRVFYPCLDIVDEVPYGHPYSVTLVIPEEGLDERFVGWAGPEGTVSPGAPLAVNGDMEMEPVFEERTLYTVSLLSDGAPIHTAKVYDGRDFIIPADPEKEWHVFRHWSDGDREYRAGDKVTIRGNTEMVAVWEPVPSVTVRFHCDGTHEVRYEKGVQAMVFFAAEAARGMVLSGWADEYGSDTVRIRNGDVWKMESDMDLYPVWIEGDRVTITYHGTVSGDVTSRHIPGDPVEIRATAAGSEDGGEFLGWSVSPSASVAEYENGDVITPADDMHLHPVYSKVEMFTVIYVDDVVLETVTVRSGAIISVGTEAELSKSGWTFSSWRDASSSATYADGYSLTVLCDMRLIAVWEEDVSPTDPTPTDPPVDPTDPTVDPTDPVVDPTDPTVDPTDPTKPTGPTVKPAVKPTGPTVKPVEPGPAEEPAIIPTGILPEPASEDEGSSGGDLGVALGAALAACLGATVLISVLAIMRRS